MENLLDYGIDVNLFKYIYNNGFVGQNFAILCGKGMKRSKTIFTSLSKTINTLKRLGYSVKVYHSEIYPINDLKSLLCEKWSSIPDMALLINEDCSQELYEVTLTKIYKYDTYLNKMIEV